jgi:hypothetical protein
LNAAYPEPDPDVRNFMLVSAQQVSSEALELRYLCFFNQLFKDVTRVIQGLPDQKSWADFALLWHTQMDTPGFRKKLYSGAIGVKSYS